MVVDGDRVGVLDAVQEMAAGAGEEQSPAVGGVDVEPGMVVAGGAGDLGQRVDEAAVGGHSSRDDRHGQLAGRVDRGERLAQRCDVHAAVGIGGDGEDGILPQSEQAGGAGHGEVGGLGREDPQARQQGNGPVGKALTQGVGAGHDKQRPVAVIDYFKRVRQHVRRIAAEQRGWSHGFFLAFSTA